MVMRTNLCFEDFCSAKKEKNYYLRISLILVVGFHTVYRSTIRGAQADSEARILGITMMVRVDIFTKL